MNEDEKIKVKFYCKNARLFWSVKVDKIGDYAKCPKCGKKYFNTEYGDFKHTIMH